MEASSIMPDDPEDWPTVTHLSTMDNNGREEGEEVRGDVEGCVWRGEYVVPCRACVRDCVRTRARCRYVYVVRRMVPFHLVSFRFQSYTSIAIRVGFSTSSTIRFGFGFRTSIPIRFGFGCRRRGDYAQNTEKTAAVERGAPTHPTGNHLSDEREHAYQVSGTPRLP